MLLPHLAIHVVLGAEHPEPFVDHQLEDELQLFALFALLMLYAAVVDVGESDGAQELGLLEVDVVAQRAVDGVEPALMDQYPMMVR